MKIKQLGFIKKSVKNELGSFCEMNVVDFVAFIEDCRSKKIGVTKAQDKVYDLLYDHMGQIPDLGGEEVHTHTSRRRKRGARAFVEDYALSKKVFYQYELDKALRQEGIKLSPSTLNSYIKDCCTTDRVDNTHFCHKDYVRDFPRFSWRGKFGMYDHSNPETSVCMQQVENPVNEVSNVKSDARVSKSPIQFSNWDSLSSAMTHELHSLESHFRKQHIGFQEAVQNCVEFLKGSENANLNHNLPKQLYNCWVATSDADGRMQCIQNLSLGFFALLEDVHFKQTGKKIEMRSIEDWCSEHYTSFNLRDYSDECEFNKILNHLISIKKSVVNGKALEFDSIRTATVIQRFAALYAFTVAKYAA